MTNQTDKFNTVTEVTYASPITNWAKNGFNFVDNDGRVMSNVELDGNNQARYRRTLTQSDLGQFNIGANFTGNRSPLSKDSFNAHAGGSTKGNAPNVTQIVAGPGIYISAPDGRGVVTVSLQPISSDITTDDLWDIQWTITDDGDLKMGTDLSQFTITGAQGMALRTRDGINTTEMSTRIPALGGGYLGYKNAVSLQSSEFDDHGVIFFTPITYDAQDGAPVPDDVGIIWGRLGHTNASGVFLGDGYKSFSSPALENGSPITGEYLDKVRCMYKSGSFNDALFVITGNNGNIWSTQGLPFDFYDTETSEGTADPKTWRLEYSSANGAIREVVSNLADADLGEYRIVAVDTDYKILYSDRSDAVDSTWTVAETTAERPTGIAYGGGTWIAVAENDTIYTSTDGVNWDSSSTGWAGTTWLAICYGNGKFIAVGTDGHVVYSTDDGVTWTRANSNTKEDLNAIAYSPTLNKFVAVGNKRAIVTVNG